MPILDTTNISAEDLDKLWKRKPVGIEQGQFWRYHQTLFCTSRDCSSCLYRSACQYELWTEKIGDGVNLRRALVPERGYQLVAIDYKGIELRIAAQLSREPFFVNAFRNGADMHQDMAKKAFQTETPTKEQRSSAKAANFGNLFLGGPKTLQAQTTLTEQEASFLWSSWWSAVPVYKSWTDSQLEYARKHGGVRTFFGRFRDLSWAFKRLDRLPAKEQRSWLSYIHRSSVNSPVQGTSADLMKIALVSLRRWITKNHLQDRVRLLLTVHDEIVLEIKDDHEFLDTCEAAAAQMIPDLTSTGWIIPIEVDIEFGYNWADQTHIDDLRKKSTVTTTEASTTAPERFQREQLILRINCTLMKDFRDKLFEAVGVAIQASEAGSDRTPLVLELAGEKHPQRYQRVSMPVRVCEIALRRSLERFGLMHCLEII